MKSKSPPQWVSQENRGSGSARPAADMWKSYRDMNSGVVGATGSGAGFCAWRIVEKVIVTQAATTACTVRYPIDRIQLGSVSVDVRKNSSPGLVKPLSGATSTSARARR